MNVRRGTTGLAVVLTVLLVPSPAAGLAYAQEPEPSTWLGGPLGTEAQTGSIEPDEGVTITDYNGDTYADLAIGVPYDDVGSILDPGTVSVLYGTSVGLSGAGDQYWHQDTLNGSASENYENFGVALAVGDFDGDSYYDLAVGVPLEDVGSVGQAGAVNIIYGSANGGLSVSGNQYWDQAVADVDGAAEEDDHFGSALAAGDFNGDGYEDLAIGIPEEDIGSVVDAGGVQVMYGTAGGLTAAQDEIWDQGSGVETGDRYGKTVAAGDFDNDGYDDLAVGIPTEDLTTLRDTGAVEILYGSAGGLSRRVANDLWHQNRTFVEGAADEFDRFGSALTTGDFNNDGYDDLAIGVPYEDVGSAPAILDAGAVNILYGSSDGITAVDDDYWHQDAGSIGGIAEESDRFGFALTAGDFDGDGFADLAVGVPYEHSNLEDTGVVQVLYGSEAGVSDAGDQLWHQDVTGILGGPEADDRFGYALTAGNFDGDAYADLAIGVPFEAIGTTDSAGAVHVVYGSSSGLKVEGNQLWYQGDGGLQGTAEAGDKFGYALAAIPTITNRVYIPLVLRE